MKKGGVLCQEAMVPDLPLAAVGAKVEVEWVVLQRLARMEIVFVRNVATKNRILPDNPVIKKRAQNVIRK